jgi:hypothetical protein
MNRIRKEWRVAHALAWLFFIVSMASLALLPNSEISSYICGKLHLEPMLLVGILGLSFSLALLFAMIDSADPSASKPRRR